MYGEPFYLSMASLLGEVGVDLETVISYYLNI